jgi:MFS family permease
MNTLAKTTASAAVRGGLVVGASGVVWTVVNSRDPALSMLARNAWYVFAALVGLFLGAAAAAAAALTGAASAPWPKPSRGVRWPLISIAMLLALAAGQVFVEWLPSADPVTRESRAALGALFAVIAGALGGPLALVPGRPGFWVRRWLPLSAVAFAVAVCTWHIAIPVPCNPGAPTWCNYDQIKNRMSESDVVRLLGPHFWAEPSEQAEYRILKWSDGPGRIAVYFKDGLVCDKQYYEPSL